MFMTVAQMEAHFHVEIGQKHCRNSVSANEKRTCDFSQVLQFGGGGLPDVFQKTLFLLRFLKS